LKQELADVTIEFLNPLQEQVRAINDEELISILEQGASKAEGIANATLEAVKERMGISGARRLPGAPGLPARN
jgi:tryptophanyl-tRNA synthetase